MQFYIVGSCLGVNQILQDIGKFSVSISQKLQKLILKRQKCDEEAQDPIYSLNQVCIQVLLDKPYTDEF